MSERKHPFYKDFYALSEMDCKYTDDQGNFNDSGICIVVHKTEKNQFVEHKEMLAKIISLCGFSIENCRIVFCTNSYNVLKMVHQPTVNYLFLFLPKEIVQSFHFRISSGKFIEISEKKLYVNSTLSQFATSKKEKATFWKALQQEFNIK